MHELLEKTPSFPLKEAETVGTIIQSIDYQAQCRSVHSPVFQSFMLLLSHIHCTL